MDSFVAFIGLVGLTPVIALSVFSGLVGAGMPLLLLVGLVDGPSGGRLDERVRGRTPELEAHGKRTHRTPA